MALGIMDDAEFESWRVSFSAGLADLNQDLARFKQEAAARAERVQSRRPAAAFEVAVPEAIAVLLNGLQTMHAFQMGSDAVQHLAVLESRAGMGIARQSLTIGVTALALAIATLFDITGWLAAPLIAFAMITLWQVRNIVSHLDPLASGDSTVDKAYKDTFERRLETLPLFLERCDSLADDLTALARDRRRVP